MADTKKKYLDLVGLTSYDEKLKGKIAGSLTEAKEYADGLGVKYDPAGTAATKVQELADGTVKTNTDAIAKLNANDTTEGSVAKAVKDAKDSVDAKIGSLDDLTTTAKGNVVAAVNEVKTTVGDMQTAGAVTVETETTTEGMAKSYTIKQGGATIATIDIPKDMVVSSGAVEVDPKGLEAGTYLVLTLANATSDKIYINVGKLVDIYTAKANATQVQIAIDSATREISATIVAGSVTATELATDAVVTAKIADGNVTKAKLSAEVQTSLGKADTAVQAADLTDLKADVSANKQSIADVKTSLADGGATATAIADAKKAGTDAAAAVSTLENGAVKTNTDNITALQGKVSALEAAEPETITAEEIVCVISKLYILRVVTTTLFFCV